MNSLFDYEVFNKNKEIIEDFFKLDKSAHNVEYKIKKFMGALSGGCTCFTFDESPNDDMKKIFCTQTYASMVFTLIKPYSNFTEETENEAKEIISEAFWGSNNFKQFIGKVKKYDKEYVNEFSNN